MRIKRRTSMSCMVVILLAVGGCGGPGDDGDNQSNSVFNENGEDAHGHDHAHTGADKLHWSEKGLAVEGFEIVLGHHGNHFHRGDTIEPAVMITQDGNDVGDAKISNCLVSADDGSVVVDKVDLVYEPKTDHEPAHYAQGNLEIPKGDGKLQIQFSIILPGSEKEHVHNIDLDVH